jgi:hypothetical protein
MEFKIEKAIPIPSGRPCGGLFSVLRSMDNYFVHALFNVRIVRGPVDGRNGPCRAKLGSPECLIKQTCGNCRSASDAL